MVDGGKLVTVVHLPNEPEFRRCRETVQHDVLVNLVGYLLPQHLEAKLEVPPLCKEVDRISASLMPQVEQLVVTSTPSFLVLGVETLVEGVPCRSPIPHGTGPSTFVSADGELRRPGGREKE